MEAEKALEQIYIATRQLQVGADVHEQLKKLVEVVLKELRKDGKQDGIK